MSTNIVSVKTLTETSGSKVTITCFSDMDENGSTTPSLVKAEVLKEVKEVNAVPGKEGELIISGDEENFGELNDKGELILDLENDNIDNYSLNNKGELECNEQG